ncbi:MULTISPECIES: type II secretion system protein N [Hyphobacterium]|uniref:Type II secretion system protein N n=1 Tax=Hyphobacterium vulgare TaxID=1736751 RepID=A0ABV6ZVB4_9PROT
MSRTALAFVFIVFLLAALAVFMPLRAISAATGVGRDAAVFGSVWNGHVQGLTAGPHRLSSAELALRPSGLLQGQAVFDWTVEDPALRGSGRAAAGFDSYRLTDVRLTLSPAAFVRLPAGLVTPQDAASIIAERVVWRGGACAEAAGSVRSDALYALGQRLGADLPALDGVLACRDGDLVILLSGDAEDASVSADITLDGPAVRVSARVETQSPDVAAVLQANGFTLSDGVWTLTLPGG